MKGQMALPPTVADWLGPNAIFYAVHRVKGNPDTVMVTVYYRNGEKRDFRIDLTKGGNNPLELYFSKLFGDAGNALTTEQSANPEEMAAIKRRVCSYCAEKLKKEALETQQYVALEKDARKLTNGHVFLDVLFEAQETEIRKLRTLYKAICEDTDKEV